MFTFHELLSKEALPAPVDESMLRLIEEEEACCCRVVVGLGNDEEVVDVDDCMASLVIALRLLGPENVEDEVPGRWAAVVCALSRPAAPLVW